MTDHEPPFDPVLEPLLARGRIIRRVADVVRARSLARARATVAAAVLGSPEPLPARWRRALPIAIAASLALAAGAAGAVVALRSPAPQALLSAPPARPASIVSAPGRALGAPPPAPSISPQCEVPAKPQRPPRLSPQESYAAELQLLGRAQAAYGRGSFAEALAVVAEHGRSFPNGRLAEEREALRVRSLAGVGRRDEAAHAAAAFADRFPRSVLLPRLRREPR